MKVHRPVVRLEPELSSLVEAERARRSRLSGCSLSTQAVVSALIREALAKVPRAR